MTRDDEQGEAASTMLDVLVQRAGLRSGMADKPAFTYGAERVRQSSMRKLAVAFPGCGFKPESLTPSYGLAESTLLVCEQGRAIGHSKPSEIPPTEPPERDEWTARTRAVFQFGPDAFSAS